MLLLMLLVGGFFLIACAVAGLVIFPDLRLCAGDFIQRQLAMAGRMLSASTSSGYEQIRTTQGRVAQSRRALEQSLARHSNLIKIGALVLIVPSVIAVWASRHTALEGFDSASYEANEQIAELLKGEQLVAPAPLPPDLFATKEVILERPMLNSASRNWELLNPVFTQRLLLVFKLMKEKHGYDMAIIEGYRSPERQNILAQQGSNVTNASAFQSYHQYGLAGDCAFLRDGKLVISERDPWAMRGYVLYGEVAASVGLTWGGNWKMKDYGHVELRLPHTLGR